MNFYIKLLLIVLSTGILPGCTTIQSTSPVSHTGLPKIVTPSTTSHIVLGQSIHNRPIELYSLGQGTDTTLIIATIHGNETAGTGLVYQLIDHLRLRPAILARHTVLIVPVMNPDGAAANTRYNARGVDLNRNFPAENRINNKINGKAGLTEPESQILYDLINTYIPNKIVVLHQPLNCLDYDGPADGLARQMGLYCELPVKKLGARPGSLGSYAGVTKNLPIITMELLREDDRLSKSEIWQKYGLALTTAITYPEQPF